MHIRERKMSFQIFKVKNAAELDSAPVALISSYPLEERDYKPYAQCNLCLSGDSLLLRMWAFELSPPAGSNLMALLYLFEDKPSVALGVTLRPGEECGFSLYEGGEFSPLAPPEGFRLHPHSGEDLQGVYWGGLAALPLEWLAGMGTPRLRGGDAIAGNFFKLCPGPQMAHYGSFFPADFLGNPYDLKSMGELLVVS